MSIWDGIPIDNRRPQYVTSKVKYGFNLARHIPAEQKAELNCSLAIILSTKCLGNEIWLIYTHTLSLYICCFVEQFNMTLVMLPWVTNVLMSDIEFDVAYHCSLHVIEYMSNELHPCYNGHDNAE